MAFKICLYRTVLNFKRAITFKRVAMEPLECFYLYLTKPVHLLNSIITMGSTTA